MPPGVPPHLFPMVEWHQVTHDLTHDCMAAGPVPTLSSQISRPGSSSARRLRRAFGPRGGTPLRSQPM